MITGKLLYEKHKGKTVRLYGLEGVIVGHNHRRMIAHMPDGGWKHLAPQDVIDGEYEGGFYYCLPHNIIYDV